MGTQISKKTKWSYCVGATGRDAAYTLVSMFVLLYIQYTAGLTASQYAVITTGMVLCSIWDAINDFMMSSVIENSHLKLGKYRPFILFGALLNAIVIVIMFTVRPSGWSFVIFFLISYLLWGMTYTVNDIAYWGMLPSLTSDPKERDSLVTLMGVFVCIGQFVVGGVVPSVIAGQAVVAFRLIALIVALSFLLFQTLTFLGVTENERVDNTNEVTFKTIVSIFKRNDQLISSGIAYVFFCVGQQILFLLATNFFFFEFGYSVGGGYITLFTVMYGLGTLVAQFVYPVLTSKLNRMTLIKYCIFVLLVGYILLLGFGYVIPKSIILLMIIGFVIFLTQGFFNLAMVVMINNTIEYDEYRFNERHDSVISAIRSFASKFSGALNQGCVSLILIVSGIYAKSQEITDLEVEAGQGLKTSEQVTSLADSIIATTGKTELFSLRVGMVIIPLLTLIIAYFILKKKYTIDEKKYSEMVTEINSRNEKQL
ncbi:MAG: glycoside-pentoside-hexuronide (GPH):cation symporter [Lachnospiraceae bacterium]|nr:glycoside-pentoside-hexuronide (GPH):cation symporter [Lachnospiraceae bacterium]